MLHMCKYSKCSVRRQFSKPTACYKTSAASEWEYHRKRKYGCKICLDRNHHFPVQLHSLLQLIFHAISKLDQDVLSFFFQQSAKY